MAHNIHKNKTIIVIPPGVRRPLLLDRCFQDRMSECGSKIAVRLKNQMRKAKVESVDRIIKKWEEKLSREVPRNTFEKRFAKWCPKMDK